MLLLPSSEWDRVGHIRLNHRETAANNQRGILNQNLDAKFEKNDLLVLLGLTRCRAYT